MLKIRKIKVKIGFIGSDRQNILKDLNFAIKNGFDYYEIQAVKESEMNRNFDLQPGIIKQARKISKENNISLNLHASWFLSLCSGIPEISKEALELAKKEIVLADKIGAKRITIHPGYKDLPEEKNFGILIKNLKELVNLGKKYQIEIGLENGFIQKYPCRKPKEVLRVVNSVKGLKVTLDIGHANVAGINPTQYFKRVKKFTIDIHIHDNDGKSDQHRLIGKGNINFKSFIRECKNSNYYGPFIFEVFPCKNVLKCREKFLNIWNQI